MRNTAPRTISSSSPATATTRFTKSSPLFGAEPLVSRMTLARRGGGANSTTSPAATARKDARLRSTSSASPRRTPGAIESEGTDATETAPPRRSAPDATKNAANTDAVPAAQTSSSRTERSSATFTSVSIEPQGVHVGLLSSAHSTKSGEGRSAEAEASAEETETRASVAAFRQNNARISYLCPA